MALKSVRKSLALLKNGINEADTGSVVNEVRGTVSTGRSKGAHPTAAGNSRNNMVSANANLRKR